MKLKYISKNIFALLLSLFLPFANSSAQNRADRLKLNNEDSFSMILLGDPQGYVKYDINQPIFEICTAWIADNIENLKIKAVLCTGDLVEQNENIVLDRKNVNQTSREMWQASSKAFARLDNKVPYLVSCGNHDYGYRHSENGGTNFPDFFPFERNSTWRDICVSSYPNRSERASIENAVFEFEDSKWGKLLAVTTEFHPRDEVLEWVLKLISSKKYEQHKVIFMTHAYLTAGQNAKHIDKDNYDIRPGNAGKEIWEKLIKKSSNIALVICGHTATANEKFEDNVSYRIDKNDDGKDVHQMMFNVQTLGGGWSGNGGDGWLRILEFLPDGKTVKVKTYSPLFGISPTTKHLANRTETHDQFDIVLK